MKTMTLDEFQAACRAQGVPREHIAVKCPVCGTIQSIADMRDAVAAASPQRLRSHFGASVIDAELHTGYSCIGRVTGVGSWTPGDEPGRGCDWTLGGFLHAHRLEVVADDGTHHPYFELASPEEAQAHMNERRPPAGA